MTFLHRLENAQPDFTLRTFFGSGYALREDNLPFAVPINIRDYQAAQVSFQHLRGDLLPCAR
jgi:hypothetical protein